MTRANGEPKNLIAAQSSSSAIDRQNGGQSSGSQEYEVHAPKVREFMKNLHDVGIWTIIDDYRIHEDENRPLAYHWWDFEEFENHGKTRGFGHVRNVVVFSDLHLAALGFHRKEQTGKTDPFRLDAGAAAFFEDLKSKLATGDKFPRNAPQIPRPYLYQAVAIWEKMDERERRRCVNAAFLHGAEGHDQGNVIKAVHNWRALADRPASMTDPKVVEFHNRQTYDGAEKAEGEMFVEFADAFKDDLGLTSEQTRVVQVLGANMIWETVYLPNFIRDGATLDQTQFALTGSDQFGAMVNAKALRQVLGLLNEVRVRAVKYNDKLFAQDFNPNDFCGGFIPGRFALIDTLRGQPEGNAMREYLDFLDEFRRARPESFSQILEAPIDGVRKIENLHDFVMERMKMQQAAADVFWPASVRNAQGKVRFDEVFKGWTQHEFQRMEQICRIYQENFWSPGYTVEQFARDIRSG